MNTYIHVSMYPYIPASIYTHILIFMYPGIHGMNLSKCGLKKNVFFQCITHMGGGVFLGYDGLCQSMTLPRLKRKVIIWLLQQRTPVNVGYPVRWQ